MPFMVIYGTSDGSSCHVQADAIDEAALFVERLRNQDGIDQIRIYRMEEISFAFRPYYKVELGLPERQDLAPRRDRAVAVAEMVVEAPPAPVAGPPVGDPMDDDAVTHVLADADVPLPPGLDDESDAAANGRRGLFGR